MLGRARAHGSARGHTSRSSPTTASLTLSCSASTFLTSHGIRSAYAAGFASTRSPRTISTSERYAALRWDQSLTLAAFFASSAPLRYADGTCTPPPLAAAGAALSTGMAAAASAGAAVMSVSWLRRASGGAWGAGWLAAVSMRGACGSTTTCANVAQKSWRPNRAHSWRSTSGSAAIVCSVATSRAVHGWSDSASSAVGGVSRRTQWVGRPVERRRQPGRSARLVEGVRQGRATARLVEGVRQGGATARVRQRRIEGSSRAHQRSSRAHRGLISAHRGLIEGSSGSTPCLAPASASCPLGQPARPTRPLRRLTASA